MSAAAPGRWVLLRGLVREAGHWGPFLPLFRAAFPHAQVDTPDLPGCGVHCHERVPADVGGLLAFVRARLPAPPPPGGLWLLGISLGGMVVCEWMRRHPEEVAGAVILNSSAADLCPPWRRMQPAAAWRLVQAAAARELAERERHVYRATSSLPEGEAAAVARWVELARAHPVRAEAAARLLFAASRYRLGALPQPRPTLVLAGAGDRLVHPGCSQALAARLGAPLAVHPRAGHDLTLDAPEWVVREVTKWSSERPV